MNTAIDLDHIVLQYAIRIAQYERAHPEVGMGPFPATMLDQALEELRIDRTSINYDYTLAGLIEYCVKYRL